MNPQIRGLESGRSRLSRSAKFARKVVFHKLIWSPDWVLAPGNKPFAASGSLRNGEKEKLNKAKPIDFDKIGN